MGEHYHGIPDPELFFQDILGELGPQVANIPGLITKVALNLRRV